MAISATTILRKVDLERYVSPDRLSRAFRSSGLYAYCLRKSSCSFGSDPGLVYDCEEYEAGEDAVCGLLFSKIDLVDKDQEIYGLCTQCQNVAICSLKDINGGVWHCEEYI